MMPSPACPAEMIAAQLIGARAELHRLEDLAAQDGAGSSGRAAYVEDAIQVLDERVWALRGALAAVAATSRAGAIAQLSEAAALVAMMDEAVLTDTQRDETLGGLRRLLASASAVFAEEVEPELRDPVGSLAPHHDPFRSFEERFAARGETAGAATRIAAE